MFVVSVPHHANVPADQVRVSKWHVYASPRVTSLMQYCHFDPPLEMASTFILYSSPMTGALYHPSASQARPEPVSDFVYQKWGFKSDGMSLHPPEAPHFEYPIWTILSLFASVPSYWSVTGTND